MSKYSLIMQHLNTVCIPSGTSGINGINADLQEVRPV